MTWRSSCYKKNIDKNDTNNNSQEVLDSIVNAADISNPTKSFPFYLKWAKLVLEEFFQQGYNFYIFRRFSYSLTVFYYIYL